MTAELSLISDHLLDGVLQNLTLLTKLSGHWAAGISPSACLAQGFQMSVVMPDSAWELGIHIRPLESNQTFPKYASSCVFTYFQNSTIYVLSLESETPLYILGIRPTEEQQFATF